MAPRSQLPSPGQRTRLDDTATWRPHLLAILERHGLKRFSDTVEAGENPTYPTFLCGDVVVKLFGGHPAWRSAYGAEREALTLLAADPSLMVPRPLAHGWVVEGDDAAWPYLVMTRIPGESWSRGRPTGEQRNGLAEALGRQIGRLHRLAWSTGVATDAGWSELDIVDGARRSSLPERLLPQIDGFLDRLDPFDRVFLHGDIVEMHVFLEDDGLSGIIDWGDAMVADRHAELIKVADLFDFNRALLRIFLEASEWPITERFAQQAMGLALIRQAQLLAQHHSSDAFHKLPHLLPLERIRTLEELADAVFAV